MKRSYIMKVERNEGNPSISRMELLKEQERPIAHLWVGRSSENRDAAEMLFEASFPFVAIPASGIAKPELLVGSKRYRGVEEILDFLKKSKP
jgi:hypothetical protein